LKNNLVVKKKALLEFKYSLGINEQRLLLASISKLDSRKPLAEGTEIEITVQEMSDLFDQQRNNVYRDMKRSCKKLRASYITTTDKDKITEINWVSTASYWHDESKVVIVFNNAILPYLTSITEKFIKYKIADVSGFQSIYSLRFYELLHQYQYDGKGSFEISIDDFRSLLDLGNKYSTFGELKRSVIEKVIFEINQSSNLKVSYGERKRNRKVVSLQFAFETKKQIIQIKKPNKSSGVSLNDFVRDNPTKTKGKSEVEVRKMMRLKPEKT
jgi:plasmid replication initiation protein